MNSITSYNLVTINHQVHRRTRSWISQVLEGSGKEKKINVILLQMYTYQFVVDHSIEERFSGNQRLKLFNFKASLVTSGKNLPANAETPLGSIRGLERSRATKQLSLAPQLLCPQMPVPIPDNAREWPLWGSHPATRGQLCIATWAAVNPPKPKVKECHKGTRM